MNTGKPIPGMDYYSGSVLQNGEFVYAERVTTRPRILRKVAGEEAPCGI